MRSACVGGPANGRSGANSCTAAAPSFSARWSTSRSVVKGVSGATISPGFTMSNVRAPKRACPFASGPFPSAHAWCSCPRSRRDQPRSAATLSSLRPNVVALNRDFAPRRGSATGTGAAASGRTSNPRAVDIDVLDPVKGDYPMCAGDDRNCPDFELHRQKLLDDLDAERRSFLKSAFVATGGAAALTAGGMSLVAPATAQTVAPRQGQPKHHYVPATADTVHWGYFSKLLKPVVEIDPGDYVTIETLTHHANDDAERMVKGDPGAESVYLWTKDKKGVNRCGAGPIDGKLLGRGAGEGFGVHICTGPVSIRGAEPGDILEVRIMDVKPRPCANPAFAGKSFGSNAAAWWGFQYNDLATDPKPREVCTIYEIDTSGQRNWAQAVYNFRWTPQTDPFGVVHKIIDYPGVPVDHSTVQETRGILKNVR